MTTFLTQRPIYALGKVDQSIFVRSIQIEVSRVSQL